MKATLYPDNRLSYVFNAWAAEVMDTQARQDYIERQALLWQQSQAEGRALIRHAIAMSKPTSKQRGLSKVIPPNELPTGLRCKTEAACEGLVLKVFENAGTERWELECGWCGDTLASWRTGFREWEVVEK